MFVKAVTIPNLFLLGCIHAKRGSVFSTKTLVRVIALSFWTDAHDYHIPLSCTITSKEKGMTADSYTAQEADLIAIKSIMYE